MGLIQCGTCTKGCMIKTCVNRNKSREENVVTTSCNHFSMKISIFTSSNSISWISGPKERISFYLNGKCKKCNKLFSSETTCEGFDEKCATLKEYQCCENKIAFKYEYKQTYLEENIVEMIRSIPFGSITPSNLATKMLDDLEIAKF